MRLTAIVSVAWLLMGALSAAAEITTKPETVAVKSCFGTLAMGENADPTQNSGLLLSLSEQSVDGPYARIYIRDDSNPVNIIDAGKNYMLVSVPSYWRDPILAMLRHPNFKIAALLVYRKESANFIVDLFNIQQQFGASECQEEPTPPSGASAPRKGE